MVYNSNAIVKKLELIAMGESQPRFLELKLILETAAMIIRGQSDTNHKFAICLDKLLILSNAIGEEMEIDMEETSALVRNIKNGKTHVLNWGAIKEEAQILLRNHQNLGLVKTELAGIQNHTFERNPF